MLRIQDGTPRSREDGGAHAGEAEASGDRQPGGGRPEDMRSRPALESGGNWSKVAVHGSKLQAKAMHTRLNPEDHTLTSPMTCDTSPSMREGATADGSHATESSNTKKISPAGYFEQPTSRPTASSGMNQPEVVTTMSKAYIVVGDVEKYPGLLELIEREVTSTWRRGATS